VPRWRLMVKVASRRLAGAPQLHRRARAAYLLARRTVARALGKPMWYEIALARDVVDALREHDAIYLPYPYMLEPFAAPGPTVATFHDVNHKYFPENFGDAIDAYDRQLRYWTAAVDVAVTSTRFIADDLRRHYPLTSSADAIIYVAPYSYLPATEMDRASLLAPLGVSKGRYLLYPANFQPHKNINALVRAAGLLKTRLGDRYLPVVFTGVGTDSIGRGERPQLADGDAAIRDSGLSLGKDVLGLGYVSDAQVDALTRGAALVVSTSLYEAGCGPALDAWQFGVPVAFSNIPPFVEQLTALGVQAWTFDPRSPDDIAAVIERALTDVDTTREMAERSRTAIARYTWEDAGRQYLAAFREAARVRAARERPRAAGAAVSTRRKPSAGG
jgi:glycosyltransferase involved in cell wall biosynthesis